MAYSEKNISQQKILLWLTALPIVLSMAVPMLLNYVETVLFKAVLY